MELTVLSQHAMLHFHGIGQYSGVLLDNNAIFLPWVRYRKNQKFAQIYGRAESEIISFLCLSLFNGTATSVTTLGHSHMKPAVHVFSIPVSGGNEMELQELK